MPSVVVGCCLMAPWWAQPHTWWHTMHRTWVSKWYPPLDNAHFTTLPLRTISSIPIHQFPCNAATQFCNLQRIKKDAAHMWWTQDPADVQRCVMYGPIAARFRPASVHIFHQRAPVTTITAIANIAIANAIMPPSASSFGPVLVQCALSTSFTKKMPLLPFILPPCDWQSVHCCSASCKFTFFTKKVAVTTAGLRQKLLCETRDQS